jgi:hypothetical protein
MIAKTGEEITTAKTGEMTMTAKNLMEETIPTNIGIEMTRMTTWKGL